MGQLIKVGIQLRKEEDSLLWGVNHDAPLTPASGGRPNCGK
jgi:hypothetical protein